MANAANPPIPPATTTPAKTGGGDNPGTEATGPVIGDTDDALLKRRVDLLHSTTTRSKLPEGYEFSLSPKSMVGSWFHRLENDDIVWQGCIVAEPASATYLCQIDCLEHGAENVQRLIPLERMVNDEEGYDWRFFDSEAEAIEAYARWVTR